jgi:CO dehydrogenase/acetyl-CoA synthase delta subunit
MPKFTITITDVEAAALAHVMDDPQEWAQNAITERARIATDEIVQREIARMVADPNIAEIPATAAEIVMAAELPAPPSMDLPVLGEA